MKLIVCLLIFVAASEAKIHFQERLQKFFENVRNNETLLQMYREHERQYIEARERFMLHKNRTGRATSAFNCMHSYPISMAGPSSVPATLENVTAFSTGCPQSKFGESLEVYEVTDLCIVGLQVHALRPEHVSVIAAMGDSLTAGNGILGTSIFDCLTEYRGRSWSIGGDFNFEQGVETLPNILKKFNPMIHGYSLGKCDETNYGCSQLNVAVAGETSLDMPDQARDLVSRLQNPNFGVDLMNEWKVITLFIGGNDLCDICNNLADHSPTTYVTKIREALDILHQNVPKAFVNLVEIFDITPLAKVSQGFFCNLITQSVCGCARNTNNNAMLQQASHGYQDEVQKLVATGRYDTRDDFTVVLQPFFRDTEPVRDHSGGYDLAYFAPDCFHFSDLGANAAGKSLWNNMIEPVGQKQTLWHLHEPFHCPHTTGKADGVFRTMKN